MAVPFFLSLAICLVILPHSFIASTGTLQLGNGIHRNLNESSTGRRRLGGCSDNTNPIDVCSGVCGDNWVLNRQMLAKCGVGYGWNALGGFGGNFYVVTDSSDDDAVNPKYGTLRFGVLQDGPWWIVFQNSMTIMLKEELIVTSYKTIDGRGVNVVLTGCSGITIQYVNNIIINDVTITNMQPCGNTDVRSNSDHYGYRGVADGDGINIFGSKDIWINHCTLSNCADGLIDMVMMTTDVTISNCRFSDHDKVMLLGHNDDYTADEGMQVTIVYNYFGENLGQRIPRVRHGYVEIVNNYYPKGWAIYAIGGSACPTIASTGNYFAAPNNTYHKEVTYHENEAYFKWQGCSWSSVNDLMLNGAFFTKSGSSNPRAITMEVKSADEVMDLTAHAGAFIY